MTRRIFIICTCFLFAVLAGMSLHAQSQKLQGSVYDNEGSPLPGVNIQLKNTTIGTTSDSTGNFELLGPYQQKYVLVLTHIGYDTLVFAVDVPAKKRIKLKLETTHITLKNVEIIGEGRTSNINNSGYNSKAIELAEIKTQALAPDRVLSKSAGVLIRQSGGVGSDMKISINGLSGKMIRYFYDGIPIEGTYLSPLFSIPLNTLNHIEIYKGVMPEYLVSDAIGGAINFVSKPFNRNYTDVSVQLSTYGYYRGFAGYRKVFKNGLSVGGYLNYLTAKNNYPIEAEVSDPVTGRVKTDIVKRFHDEFSIKSGRIDVGVVNKKFADILMLSVMASNTSKQIQHGILMSEPCGEAHVGAAMYEAQLRYKKDSIFNNRLQLEFVNSISQNTVDYTDSSRNIYNWYGQITGRRLIGNELYHFDSPHLAHVVSLRNYSKLYTSFTINKTTQLKYTGFYSLYRRSGRDPLSAAETGIDPYASNPKVTHFFSGLSIHKEWFDNRIKTISGVKELVYNASQTMVQGLNGKIEASGNYTGFWQVLQCKISNSIKFNLSYEYAYRLPDPNELFGDVVITSPNTELKPEKSHNLNAGIRLTKEYEKLYFDFSVNGFNRWIKDIIFLGFPVHGAHYSNVFDSRSYGIEAEGSMRYKNEFRLLFNVCWQELVNMSNYNYDGTYSTKYYNTRLPNTPWLFGHLAINYTKSNLGFKNTKTEVFGAVYYTHSFYLRPEADGGGSSKYTIPSQVVPNVGIIEYFNKINTSVGFEIHNITNTKSYDNFRVQKPGRTFHLVLRYAIK